MGLSTRTANYRRQVVVAFVSWCKRTGRVESNPLSIVSKLDEERDRRRVRRPLTEDELARLLGMARLQGRAAWYLAAIWTGLRKSELAGLTWADVDFADGSRTIR